MKIFYATTLLVMLASSSSAAAQSNKQTLRPAGPIFLDCPEIRSDGAKIYISDGRLPGSQVKILVGEKKLYTWNWEDGSGYFRGGGHWVEFGGAGAEVQFIDSDNTFKLKIISNNQFQKDYTINRVTGSVASREWDGTSFIVKTGVCEPTKDPESIPAPVAKF